MKFPIDFFEHCVALATGSEVEVHMCNKDSQTVTRIIGTCTSLVCVV